MLATAQPEPGLGSWTVLNLRGTIKGKFRYMAEAQLRSTKFYNNFFYYEYKGGVSYRINKSFSFLTGIGKYNNYTVGGNFMRPLTGDEIRLWEEVTMHHDISRLFFEHRYRIEQRFFTTGYRNRFRYRLGIAIPINNKVIANKTVYTTLYNEVFFTNKGPYFERNRFFAGMGFRLSPVTIQLGWINQLDYTIQKQTIRNFLQFTLSFEIKGKAKSQPEILPLNED